MINTSLLLLLLDQQLFRPQLLLLLLEVVLLEHLLDAPRLQLLVARLAHVARVLSSFAQTGFANKPIPVVRSGRFSSASTE
jgi:hypothetical protein